MTYTSLAHVPAGHAPSPDKSPIQKWISRLTGVHRNAPAHVHHTVHAVRQYSEAGLVGAAFGALDATKPQYSDKAQLGTAAVGLVGAMIGATEDYATDLRNIGSDAVAIFTFRKGKQMVESKRLSAHGEPGGRTHGDSDWGTEMDPIVEAAKHL